MRSCNSPPSPLTTTDPPPSTTGHWPTTFNDSSTNSLLHASTHSVMATSGPTSRLSIATTTTTTSPSTSRSATPNINLKLPLQGATSYPHSNRSPVSPGSNMTANANGTWLSTSPGLESGSRLDANSVPLQPIASPAITISAHHSADNVSRRPGTSSSATSATSVSSVSDEWNASHPCYPHRNPHVPKSSPEYESTRVIRIQRDYMYSGDLSPAFSNVYPEILEHHLGEQRFREIVKRLNEMLFDAHDPWNWGNWVDAAVGMVTLWMAEEILPTRAKRKLREAEEYLKAVNDELREEGLQAKIIELRRTGYLNLDIQIPDPQITVEGDVEEGSVIVDESGNVISPEA